jgi:primosomal protein N' (replication factor Y)
VVRGRFRFRLLAKSQRAFDLSGYMRGWLANAPKIRGTLKLEIDIDPQSFF